MSNKGYLGLFVINVACLLSALCLSNNIVMLYGITFSAASIVFPITFLLTDICAEVYGFKYAKELMWSGLLAQVPFAMICYFANMLPHPTGWAFSSTFDYVFQNLFTVSFSSMIGAFIGQQLNIKIFSKLKSKIGRLPYAIRSTASSGSGELVFTIIAVPLMFLGKVPFEQLISIILTSATIKIIYSTILTLPASLIVNLLKNKRPIAESKLSYNPFDINLET
jgi:uncharacterized integral membrane protein (TIGR00697 family)